MLEGQHHRRLISTGIITPSIEVTFPITISTEPTYHGLMKSDANPTPAKMIRRLYSERSDICLTCSRSVFGSFDTPPCECEVIQ